MTFAEMMFYAEAEGLLPTRAGKINAAINEIKAYPSPSIDEKTFCEIIERNGLSFSSLSPREIRYINACIAE